jgi:hypothetical protein
MIFYCDGEALKVFRIYRCHPVCTVYLLYSAECMGKVPIFKLLWARIISVDVSNHHVVSIKLEAIPNKIFLNPSAPFNESPTLLVHTLG